jgi:2-polyprenyl-3-methyl-5-hydroxy-6-metoxy-1,4-benzoquinol methylase
MVIPLDCRQNAIRCGIGRRGKVVNIMDAPSGNAVRDRFEREAKSFDAIYRLERSPYQRWFNTTFRKAIFERYDITFREAGDVTGKSILDIGCGSGVYSVDFARRGAQRVVGVDFSGGMLELARQEAREHGQQEVCEFIQTDFLDLDTDEEFNVSIAMGVFDYLEDPLTFLKKMASMTSEKVIVSFPGHSMVRERARSLRYKLAGKGIVRFYSETEVRRLASEVGFKETVVIPISSSGSAYVLVGKS